MAILAGVKGIGHTHQRAGSTDQQVAEAGAAAMQLCR
jgi:hypothetical protein